MSINTYYYDQQLKTYILQFMAIFSNLQVKIGKFGDVEERLIPVPIIYGAQDRVVASILADHTQNKPLRLPTMSAYMRNISLDPSRAHGVGFERRQVYTPVGGLVPEDTVSVHQRIGMPFKLEMELAIYVSNSDQHFQILEQILPFFEPTITIQKSDSIFDNTRLTSVELTNVNVESPYPIGTDRRIIQSSLVFEMPIWLSTPADVRKDFVQKVFLRIGAVDTTSVTNFEIIADLDDQGIEYDLIQQAPTV